MHHRLKQSFPGYGQGIWLRYTYAKMENPKTILITGASSGIGEALALHYAAPGVTLALSGRNAERLQNVAEACRSKGAEVESALVDVTDRAAMENWIGQVNEETPLQLIIANAGISGGPGGRIDGEPVSEARKIFAVNLTGVLNTVEPALKIFQGTNGPRQIAIVSSLAGFRGWPGAPAYTASKGAVRFYGEAMRGALSHTNIEINVICPGFVKTRMTAKNNFPMPFNMDPEKAAVIIARGLTKNKGRIAFPLPTHFFAWFMSILPDALALKILNESPSKPALLD
jgi:short-subunit dehydrogenase